MPGFRTRRPLRFWPVQLRVPRALVSLAAVGLVAAGVGYALGLYVTGEMVGRIEPSEAVAEPDGPERATGTKGGPEGSASTGEARDPSATPSPREQPAAEPASGVPAVRIQVAVVPVYVAQLGAFGSAENAEALAERLRAAGFDAVVVPIDGYRVWSGGFPSRQAGQPYVDQLARAGFERFLAERQLGGEVVLPLAGDDGTANVRRWITALPELVQARLQVNAGGEPTELRRRLEAAIRDLDAASQRDGSQDWSERVREVLARMAASLPDGTNHARTGLPPGEAAQLVAEVEMLFRELGPSGSRH